MLKASSEVLTPVLRLAVVDERVVLTPVLKVPSELLI